MKLKKTIAVINQMQAAGVIGRYAIGGAVGATFYLEPMATVDVDVFVAFPPEPGRLIIAPKPIYDYLTARGYKTEGEYLVTVHCSMVKRFNGSQARKNVLAQNPAEEQR